MEEGARGAKGRGVPSDAGDDALEPDAIAFGGLKSSAVILAEKLAMQDCS